MRSGPPVKTERDYFVEAARRAGVVIEVKTGGESWLEKTARRGRLRHLIEIAWGGHGRHGHRAARSAARHRRAIDRALDAMAAAWDPAERAKLSNELAAALAEAWPIAGIVADAPQGLVHRRVQNVKVWDGWIDLSQLKLESHRKKRSQIA